MTRTASITLSAAILLAGFYAFAQEPAPRQPTNNPYTQPATQPGAQPAAQPGSQFAPASIPVPPGFPNQIRSIPGLESQQNTFDEGVQRKDHELTRESKDLVAKYGHAKEATEKADVQKELARVVADHFTLRQEIREKELQELEEQLKHLRTVHQQRAAEKDRIVTDRVQQLLRESSGLGWGTDSPQRGGSSLWNNSYQNSTPRTLPASR